ncbi:hypothetical protein F4778DRAFT_443586 [Xylariomycetidae sp. FL2044]|nr:hypothetical protein F4778DRAFT_443586 [Xylariomycetidae sp. FL2044]
MADKLSEGNKRKLSRGIAIVGSPSILLLGESFSGMVAVAKRVMWKVIASVEVGSSLVIKAHSMEEVSALADLSEIMANRMLCHQRHRVLLLPVRRRLPSTSTWLTNGARRPGRGTFDASKCGSWRTSLGGRVSGLPVHGQVKFVIPIGGQGAGDGGGGCERVRQSRGGRMTGHLGGPVSASIRSE